ncbi:trypsin-like peptidase domain-containing protein [Lentzea flava]|uniref:Nephrocystin 3-like N-terminal domain-containing protein n=1 Tax=Lentzea flava TaxID=103732 RepID=A0ABQ2UTT5_9PSEU|nr:trypsin-like peptidase domain-containing protein [Lentzea flava]MCP2201622.1 NACHT domain-containing protein [Lentzea flava]GGU53246.1 hypothetical protein GCM10010178_52620 [Lentzea flava]
MSGAPLDRARVAELIVTRAGERHRGSGYRVRGDAVLTAAHVVDGADSVRIRFEPDLPGEWTVDAISWWADPVSDVAVVLIEPRDGETVARISFGRIEDRAAVLTVEAVGFPWWKMRTDAAGKRYRDSCHAVGTIAVLSNWREGTLEVVVEPATARDDENSSPWEGMSGAALWANGHIVGVIAKHHPGDGLGRLAAVRLDLALDRVDPEHGTPLRDALAVPAPLPGVLPAPRPELVTNAYQALVADAAPERLYDRNWELDELVRFCAGDEPYLWWQAGPWAGKSALLAWFALHPPDGVDVVSFFIVARQASESDSDAFIEALIEQLTALVGEPPELVQEARARRGHMLRLLNLAAARCVEAGRTLLLVVDGLDEDASRADGTDRPSIASLLPRRPPPGVRVLVASRPHPDLPDDVSSDHPLRTVVPRQLTASPYAKNLEDAAKRELTTLLAKPGLQRQVLGLITASGGGLTQSDLEELTGQPPFELEALFGGMLGRSVGARSSRDHGERVYLFTHDTLREQAERKYGNGIAIYHAQLHEWADRHRARGWTEDTPVYLLRGYPRLLAALGDVERLVACATDRARHDRMLALTGGDALALSEIDSASRLLARAPRPDLLMLLRVALARVDLGDRNVHIPPELPGVWASLGEIDRAVALASSIADDQQRAEALTRIISVLVESDDQDRVPTVAEEVERAALKVGHPLFRYEVLLDLAAALSGGDHEDHARRLGAQVEEALAQIGESFSRDELLGKLVRLYAMWGDHERALARLADIENNYQQCGVCKGVLGELLSTENDELVMRYVLTLREDYYRKDVLEDLAAAVHHDAERALRYVLAIDSEFRRVNPLRTLATEAVDEGDDDRALRFAALSIEPDELLVGMIDHVLALGDTARATKFAERIAAPFVRADTWIDLALVHVENGDAAQAAQLVTAAEAVLPDVVGSDGRALVLAGLASVMTRLGMPERAAELNASADTLAAGIADELVKAETLGGLAVVALDGGDHDRYARLADLAATVLGRHADHVARANGLTELAQRALWVNDSPRARRLAGAAARALAGLPESGDVRRTAWILTRVAFDAGAVDEVLRLNAFNPAVAELIEVAAVADDARAAQVAGVIARREYDSSPERQIVGLAELGEDERALALAARVVDYHERDRALLLAAETAVDAGDDARAMRFVAAVRWHDDACARLASSLAGEGQFDRAAGFVRAIDGTTTLDREFQSLAKAAVEHGDVERALALLGEVTDSFSRAAGVAAIAATAVANGDTDRARTLCLMTEESARRGADKTQLTELRIDLALALMQAGDSERAQRLVRATDNPDLRLEAFAEFVSDALDRADDASARAFADELVRIERAGAPWRYQKVIDVLLRVGDVAMVRRIVEELEAAVDAAVEEYDRTALRLRLIEPLSWLGHHEKALERLSAIRDESHRYQALAAVARTAPEGFARDRVKELIIRDADDIRFDIPNYWLPNAGTALAVIGEFERALTLVRSSTKPSEQSEVLQALAKAAPGDPELRRELFGQWKAAAGEIADVYYRDGVYVEFATVLDKRGEHEEAARLAALITDPARRAEEERKMRLRAIAAGRDTAGARSYVAEALIDGDWPSVLPAVAKVDLAALQQFADEILG